MAAKRVKFNQVLRTAAITDGRVALSATDLWVQRATVLGYKTLAGGANTGTINVGPSSAASEQPFPVTTGAQAVIECGEGCEFNLANWYFTVASDNDGVVVIYY